MICRSNQLKSRIQDLDADNGSSPARKCVLGKMICPGSPGTVQASIFGAMRVLARLLRILVQGRNIHRFLDFVHERETNYDAMTSIKHRGAACTGLGEPYC